MTMPKFEPVAWRATNFSDNGDDYAYRDADDRPVGISGAMVGEPLYTADQLTEAYEAGKQDATPEGWVLVPKEILDRFPEINPSNYDHDDACNLNAWGVELVLAAAPKGEE